MKNIWSHFFGILVIVFMSGGVTGSFFNDVEGSEANIFSAFKLDAEVEGAGFSGDVCAIGAAISDVFTFKNVGGLDFEYTAENTNLGGDIAFCNLLELKAFVNDSEVYSGPVGSFIAGIFELPYTGVDDWEFEIRVPEFTPPQNVDGKICTFDTIFNATQRDFLTGQAFYDIETLSHVVGGSLGGGGGLGDVTIDIDNNATVTNTVNVTSSTGGNSASGGDGGDGSGGDGGDGDDGGDGGDGGTTQTGDSYVYVYVSNEVNTNETTVSGCGCGCPDDDTDCAEEDTTTQTTQSVTTTSTGGVGGEGSSATVSSASTIEETEEVVLIEVVPDSEEDSSTSEPTSDRTRPTR